MKHFIIIGFAFMLLFPQQIFAAATIITTTDNASATSDVQTSVEGSSTTTTHIETTVNGHTTTFDSTTPGTYHVVSTNNGTTITSIPEDITPTISLFPTPTLHSKIHVHKINFFSQIKTWLSKLIHSL